MSWKEGANEEDGDNAGVAGDECGGTAGENGGEAPLEEDEVGATDKGLIPKAVAFIKHPEGSYSSEEHAGGGNYPLNLGCKNSLQCIEICREVHDLRNAALLNRHG